MAVTPLSIKSAIIIGTISSSTASTAIHKVPDMHISYILSYKKIFFSTLNAPPIVVSATIVTSIFNYQLIFSAFRLQIPDYPYLKLGTDKLLTS